MSALLAGERTPVLGPAGIGKSTICLQALHDPRVAERFGARRYFVRCDAAITAEALLAQIGADLSLEASPDLSAKMQRQLAEGPVTLVLDNLETPWDQEQLETEEVLKQLSSVESLALVGTIRGSSRPLGVAWRDALQVTPLAGDDPRHLFLAIAGARHENDAHLSRLLSALDGMPLAIELMAHATEAEPDLESVWRRWQAERAEMLKRGKGDQRLLSLAVSLELSIASPRMTDSARRLLAMLGLLPNGIARGDLNTLLPNCGYAAAATLRQTALAFDEAGRLRCLAPVREYVSATHRPSSLDFQTSFEYHNRWQRGLQNDMRQRLNDIGDRLKNVARLVKTEPNKRKSKDGIGNIERKLRDLLNDLELTTKTGAAVLEHSIIFLLRSLSDAREQNRRDLEASCLFALAQSFRLIVEWNSMMPAPDNSLMLAENNDQRCKDAQDYADKALALFRLLGDSAGEADCIEELDAITRTKSQDPRVRGTDKKSSGSTRASRSRTRPTRRM